MKRAPSCAVLPLLLPVLALSVGCDMSNTPAGQKADLQSAYKIYLDHIDEHGQGPAGWDEFAEYAAKYEARKNPDSIKRLRDGGYQFKWNVKFQDATDGIMRFVLAEAAGKPTLMLDGSVRN